MSEILTHTEEIYDVEEIKKSGKFFPFLSKFTFVLFLFFVLFGTTLPFQPKATEADEITTSNIVNVIVYTFLFLTSMLSLIPKFKDVFNLIYKEKIFTIFLFFSLASMAWSDYPFITFKRWFQVFTAVTVAFSIFLHTKNSLSTLKYFKFIYALYLIISIIVVFIVPGATNEEGIWKGLAPSKNHLGQAALINIIVWAGIFSFDNLRTKFFSIFMLMISLILLFGSKSTTALITFVILLTLAGLFYIDDKLSSLKIGRMFSTVSIITGTTLIIALVFAAPDLVNMIFTSAGEDTTFTGRTDLWMDIINEAKNHWLLGCGFQAFWVVESPEITALYATYLWLPNQAHNGYIDILNEVGVVGLIMFFLVIINYLINIIRVEQRQFYKWFFIAALVLNLQESTFIRPQVLTGVLFMLAYIALFSDRLKEKYFDPNQLPNEMK